MGRIPSSASAGPIFNDGEHRIRLADQIGVGQHDALGIGGGARGVEQRRQIVFGGDDGLKAGGAGGEDGIEIGGEDGNLGAALIAFCAMSGMAAWSTFVAILFRCRRSHHQSYVESRDRLHRHRKMLDVAEQQGSSAVEQQRLHLAGVEGRVEWDRGSSGGDDP